MAEGGLPHPLLNRPILMLQQDRCFWEFHEVPYRLRYRRDMGYPRRGEVIYVASLYSQLTLEETEARIEPPYGPDEQISLEQRMFGVEWHNRGEMSTAHLDGFLSTFIRWIRRTKGTLLKEIEKADKASRSLLEIAKLVLRGPRRVDSEEIKKVWLRGILEEEFPALRNFNGQEPYSVFQHMTGQSGLRFIVSCEDGEQYWWTPYLRVTEPVEIHNVESIFRGEDPGHENRERPFYQHLATCSDCGTPFKMEDIRLFPCHWCLILKTDGEVDVRLDQIPVTIRIDEDFRVKVYRLAYVSYEVPEERTGIRHQVSLQRYGNEWYLQNGMLRQAFSKWENKQRYNIWGAVMTAIVYFLDPQENILREEALIPNPKRYRLLKEDLGKKAGPDRKRKPGPKSATKRRASSPPNSRLPMKKA